MSAKSRAASAYTRTESCLSTLSKPEQDDNEPKSKYFWRLIRHCVKEAVDLTKIADTKTLIVSHGLHHNRRLNHPKQLRHVVINKATKVGINNSYIEISFLPLLLMNCLMQFSPYSAGIDFSRQNLMSVDVRS